MIGGTIFCALFYWYMHLYDEPEIALDGVYYQRQSQLEEGNLFAVHSGTIMEEGGGKSSNSSGEIRGLPTTTTTASGL